MSIKKHKGKKVVRYSGTTPAPYLRDHIDLFTECDHVLDLGCGSGRNTNHLRSLNVDVSPYDMCPDFGDEWMAHEVLPQKDSSVDGILLNYILMFLTVDEIDNVAQEINRVAKPGCVIMVELEVVKNSFIKSPATASPLS